jgi:hypothetical protein
LGFRKFLIEIFDSAWARSLEVHRGSLYQAKKPQDAKKDRPKMGHVERRQVIVRFILGLFEPLESWLR